MKDTTFFDRESAQYEKKRYTKKAESYLQAFFNHRLAITKSYVREVLKNKNTPSVLEVGCADGVIIRELCAAFPAIKKITGIDIASYMIEEAKRRTEDPRARFFVRGEYPHEPVDLVVETGVINYSRAEDELLFAYEQLSPDGWFILSVAGVGSLYNRIKHDSLSDFRAYREYEPLIRQHFEVIKVEGVGFFIPLIWKFPLLARPLQALAEAVMGALAPGLCHEKMYLLRKKTA